MIRDAAPDVDNALGLSYIEDVTLGECSPERYRAVKERMPVKFRAKMAAIDKKWR